MAESTIETEKWESRTVKSFVTNLENGTSVVQAGNETPCYMKNFATGKVPQGLAQLTLKQGCYDNDIKGTLFLTHDQAIKTGAWPEKGSKSIGSLPIRNVYSADDKAVIEGKAKAGDKKKDADGKEMEPFSYIACFAAEKTVFTKWEAERDENGQVKRYPENILSKDHVYTKDREFKDSKGEVIYSVKKGDPVIEHLAGSVVGHEVATTKTLAPAKINILPKINDDKQLFDLPKPKDNSAFETLKCGMAQFFRGIYHGNGEGWRPSNAEIQAIKTEFINAPGKFSSAISQADTYGRGNKAECEKMEKAINEKRLQNEKVNEKVNVNQNQKSHKRS